MNDSSQSVAIITVTYNAEEFILDYLESIHRILDVNSGFSAVLVDNASADSTVKKVQSYIEEAQLASRITCSPLEENIGFGRGCNAGAEIASQQDVEYLWFLNPDTTMDIGAEQGLLNVFNSKKNSSFVGSTLKDENGVIRSGAFRFPTIRTTLLSASMLGALAKIFPSRVSTIPIENEVVEAEWLSGASFMVRSSAFADLGGFDPEYFLYYEEVDLFYRAYQHGHKILSSPDSVVFHASGASTGINKRKNKEKPPRKPSYWFKSRRYFYLKNFGTLYFACIDIAFIVGSLLKLMKNKKNGSPNIEPEHILKDILNYSVVGSKTNH